MGSENSKSKNENRRDEEKLKYGQPQSQPKAPPPIPQQYTITETPLNVSYSNSNYPPVISQQANQRASVSAAPISVVYASRPKAEAPKPPLTYSLGNSTLSTIETNPFKTNANQGHQYMTANTQTYQQNSAIISKNSANFYKRTINFDEVLPGVKKAVSSCSKAEFIKMKNSLNKNHSLGESRKMLINNPYLADVKFLLGHKEIYAHKAFLITSSILFYETFTNNKVMKIEEISEEIFLILLNYCYTNQLKLNADNVLPILNVANKLKICQATNICHGFISNMINNETVFNIFEKAIELDSEMFQKKCLDYIAANEAKCFNSKGFYNIKISSLTTILQKCQYNSIKSSELIEKWNHGALETATVSNSNPVVGGTKKKAPPKQNKNKAQAAPKIPSLIDIVIPSPPMPEGFIESFDLINFDDDDKMSVITYDDYDDDDNKSDIICIDDEDEKAQINVVIKGERKTMETEFSRIDFVAKRNFNLHSIWFNENLFPNTKEIKIHISVLANNKRTDIHNRVIKNNKPGMKLNFVKFSKKPLKFFGGQKCTIKIKFSEKAPHVHVNTDSLSSTNILDIDRSNKKYFNSISKFIVSEQKRRK
ncbi:hypothetical protein PVAND_009138 [Polypedilum vanderplanki]|uniref:BTB domain-containing protein n=1 Tax=Polypedilum vanderplanki TaxID=319348 RepID=A0A9J6CBZ7_POLVA|nr:hypothetical protein PVAND_009138 [Polypedilum vanderplanki]